MSSFPVDPVFGSMENDTYAVLQGMGDELIRRGVRCRVYHFGQDIGRAECLEPVFREQRDRTQVPQLSFDGDLLVFGYVFWGIPDPKNCLYPLKEPIATFDIRDPECIEKMLVAIVKWYKTYSDWYEESS